MKQYLLLLALLLCLGHTTGFAQNTQDSPWQQTMTDGLTGQAFKMPPKQRLSKWMLGLCASLAPGQRPPAALASGETFGLLEQSLHLQPERWEQLHERLGGEFWFATPTQSGTFPDVQPTPEHSVGLQAILSLGSRWTIQAGVAQGRFSSTATFPVTVFDQQNGHKRSENGEIRTKTARTRFEAAARYYLPALGIIRPFASLGVQYARQRESAPTATLKEVSWTFGEARHVDQWAGLAQAGISLQPRRWPVFAEISAAATAPGGKISGRFQVALGWKGFTF